MLRDALAHDRSVIALPVLRCETAQMTLRVYLRLALAGGLAVVSLALAGCASGDSSDESPELARDRLYDFLDETQGVLGGVWENQDDPTSRGCVIPLFTEGETYPALRVGSPPANVAAAVASVTTLWRTRGYTVDEAAIDTVREVQAEGDNGEIVVLRVSAEAMTLHGESECRPLL